MNKANPPQTRQRIRPIALAALLFFGSLAVVFVGSAVFLLNHLSVTEAFAAAGLVATEKLVPAFLCALLTFFMDSRKFRVTTTVIIYVALFVGLLLLMQVALHSGE